MNKRIVIVSPIMGDREELEYFLRGYFKKNFAGQISGLHFDKLVSLYSPPEEERIGHEYEILVVFDRRINAEGKRIRDDRGKPFAESVIAGVKLTKYLCNSEQIPYVEYKGEFKKNQEMGLVYLLDGMSKKIQNRFNTFNKYQA